MARTAPTTGGGESGSSKGARAANEYATLLSKESSESESETLPSRLRQAEGSAEKKRLLDSASSEGEQESPGSIHKCKSPKDDDSDDDDLDIPLSQRKLRIQPQQTAKHDSSRSANKNPKHSKQADISAVNTDSPIVNRPRRKTASKNTKKWEKDYVIGSSDGEMEIADEEDEDWGEAKEEGASSEEWDPDPDSDDGKPTKKPAAGDDRKDKTRQKQSRAAANRYLVGGTVARERGSRATRGNAGTPGSGGRGKSATRAKPKRRLSSSEEEEGEASDGALKKGASEAVGQQQEGAGGAGYGAGAGARPKRSAANRRERAAATLSKGGGLASLGRKKNMLEEDEADDDEEGGGKVVLDDDGDEDDDDVPLVTPKAQRSQQRESASRTQARYFGGAGGSGGGGGGRRGGSGLSGVDIMGSKRGKQIVSSKQMVVCPLCYRQMEKYIPDASAGQTFEYEALVADPLEVVLRKGEEKLGSFVFAGSREFKQHYREQHRSSKVPSDVSQFYLKQFVYNHLTKTTREANYSMLNTMKYRGVHDNAEDGDRPELSLSSDSKMIAAYWGENDHLRAFRYNDILGEVLNGGGSRSPLFSEVEESAESEEESDIDNFIDDGDGDEDESESEEENERDKQKRLEKERRRAERKEEKRQKRAREEEEEAAVRDGRPRKRRVVGESDDGDDNGVATSSRGEGARRSQRRVVDDEDDNGEEEVVEQDETGLGSSQLTAEVVDWVECDVCCKWRKIPAGVEIDKDDDFTCSMLPGMSCSVPQEEGGEEGGGGEMVVAEGGTTVAAESRTHKDRSGDATDSGSGSDGEGFTIRKPASTPRKGKRVVLDSDEEGAVSSQGAVQNLDGGRAALDFSVGEDENSQEAFKAVRKPVRKKVKHLADSDDEDDEEGGEGEREGEGERRKGKTPPTTPSSKYGFRTRHKKGYEQEETGDWRDELKQRNRNLLTGKVSTKSEEAAEVVELVESDDGSMEDFVVNDSGDEYGDDWQSRAADMEAKRVAAAGEGGGKATTPKKEHKRAANDRDGSASKDVKKNVEPNSASAAIAEGNVLQLRARLKESPTQTRHKQGGRTLLHAAIDARSLSCVKELVRSGALVNARDDAAGTTPLLLALQERQVEIFRWLLEHGADVMQADVEGTLPLHMAAAACSYSDVSRVLGKMQTKDRRLGVNARDNRGQQAMHYAAAEGNLEVMKKLCSNHDADANCRDSHDLTPLHVMAMSGQADHMLAMCREVGADVRAQDIDGMTALHHAAHSGHGACVDKLIELGSWVDLALPLTTSLTPGATALHLAAAGGHKECVKSLIASSARVDMRDNQNWTPLLYADFVQSRECVVALLQPENPEICATQLQHLGILLQGDRAETQDRVIKVIEYVATVPEFYDAINQYVERTPQVLDGTMRFLLKNKSLLSFPNKQAWFQRQMLSTAHALASSHFSWDVGTCRVVVSRAQLADSTLAAVMGLEFSQLRDSSFSVVFEGEEGVGTGPTREFFQSAPQAVLDPDLGLFELTEDGSAYHPKAGAMKGSEWKLEAVGRLVGLALRNENVVNVRLSRTFMRLVLGEPLDLEHLQDIDAQLHRSLAFLLETKDATEHVEATFSVMVEEDGEQGEGGQGAGAASESGGSQEPKVIPDSEDEAVNVSSQESAGTPKKKRRRMVELCKNGSTVAVTEENKADYVEKYATYKLVTSIQEHAKSFKRGLLAVIPRPALRIFSEHDLELLLCGLPSIDVAAWQHSARYSGVTAMGPLTAESRLAGWFWDFVFSREEVERALLLKFCTGSATVPARGFMHLPGLNSECPFTLSCVGPGDGRLPTASTCFNLLKVPDYSTKAILEERLHVALHYGAEGFSFS